MFNIDERPGFTAQVDVVAPDGTSSDFRASFEALDIPAFEAFELADPAGARAFLERVVTAIADIVDDAGKPVADSAQLRGRLYDLPWVRPAMIRAYLDGVGRAARGN